MIKKAWQIDRETRLNAVPMDRRVHQSSWFPADFTPPCGDDLIDMFWESRVPGSGAPECAYVEMVQSLHNRGYDVSEAEKLLPPGLELHRRGDRTGLRALTARLWEAMYAAPIDPSSPYHRYEHPAAWEQVRQAMGKVSEERDLRALENLEEKIHHGWLGQLAGGAFGTAIEGYTGRRIAEVYGRIESYVTTPETTNDDVVYELVLLDAFQRSGRKVTSREIAVEWVRQIPFGWSAEWVALRNLQMGIFPPESGSFRNPYHDWIGAQMRTMICGMLAPGWPLEAARLAHIDGVISHAANGVYGGMYAAVLTSLAFVRDDPQALLVEAAEYVPQKSEYRAVVGECLEVVRANSDPQQAWDQLDERFEEYNWIHAYPNIAADIVALWYGQGDMTRSFALLAMCGMDVDCNGGLVGNILGVMNGTPGQWADPLGDRLDTYIAGKESLSIRQLAANTAALVRQTW